MSFKNFSIRLVLFFLLFFIADQISGMLFGYLDNKAGDKYARENYLRNGMDADCIIMGSSKANHHYVASLLGDSLGMTAYNCGQRGNGIIYEYGRLCTLYERYTPKLLILDVYYGFDLLPNDNSRYLNYLKKDYGNNKKVDSIFYSVDKWNKYKMILNTYRYNSTICDVLLNIIFKGRSRFQSDGYYPLYGKKLKNDPRTVLDERERMDSSCDNLCDSLKIYYLKRLIQERKKDSSLIFTISPTFRGEKKGNYNIIRDICLKNNIPLLDYSNDERFVGVDSLFYDDTHLNNVGAFFFTRLLANDIKRHLNLLNL